MSATTLPVARATDADRETLGEVLARAFHDDPVFEWLVPDPAARGRRLPAVFAAFADVFLSHDETYLAGRGAGAALWAPAGRQPVPDDRAEALGEQLAVALGDDAERAAQLGELLEEHHPEQPCFHLQFVGVVPEHRRRGLGSRMLEVVLQRCDATGTPAHLEATSVDNRRLYQRHGFEVVDELVLPDGPALWPMWREPTGG